MSTASCRILTRTRTRATVFSGFLPRDVMRIKQGRCCRPVSVCLSVCLSVTLVHCILTADDIVKLLSRPGSPIILVFDPQRRYTHDPFSAFMKSNISLYRIQDNTFTDKVTKHRKPYLTSGMVPCFVTLTDR